ncbi:MAG: lipopolysaccharide biosynthesis protein [Anaerolineae bacterium]|nr:lipopolysaccharide biosynthesis protein [Anaerolineae bacterium]
MKNIKSFSARSPYFSRFSHLGKEFIWISIGEAVAVIASLIGLRLFTNYLSPAVFGEVALIMTLATLVNQLLFGPLAGAVLRFLAPAHEAGAVRAYLDASRHLAQVVTLVVVALTAVFTFILLVLGRSSWVFFLITAVLYALLTGYNLILNGMQNALRQRKVVAWHTAIGQWLQVIFVLAAIFYFGATSYAVMLGYLVAAACILPSQFYFFRRKVLGLTQEEAPTTTQATDALLWQGKMKTYALPFMGWGAFSWAQMSSDRWALQVTGSTSEVGYFAILYRLGYYPISLLTNLVVQLLTPVLFQKAGDASNRQRMAATYRANQMLVMISLGTTAVAVLAAYLLHNLIFSLFVAPEYGIISWLLPWMVLAGGLFATGQIATIGVLSESETRSLLAPKIVTAVLGTLLNFVAAYYWGLAGVVGAIVFAAAVYMVWIVLLGRQRQKERPSSSADEQSVETAFLDESLMLEEQTDFNEPIH